MTLRDIDVVPRMHGSGGKLLPTGDKTTLRSEIARGATEADKRTVVEGYALASPQTPSGELSLRDRALASQVAPHRVVTSQTVQLAASYESSALSGRDVMYAASEGSAAAQVEKTGFWSGLFSKAKKLLTGAADVAVGIAKGVKELGKLVLVDGLPKLATKEFWSGVGSGLAWVGEKLADPATWKAAGELWWKGITLGPRAIAYAIAHPVDSLKKVGSFLKGMSDGLGVTDLCVGVGRLFTGDFGGAVQALKGAGKAFLEFTGIGDAFSAVKHLGLALYCLGTGDKMGAAVHLGQAVMHGTFAAMSIGSIAATVATGGAAAGAIVGVMMLRQGVKSAAKQVLKTAAKEFLECAGKDVGKAVVKELGQKLTPEVMKKAAGELADQGAKQALHQAVGEQALKQLMNPMTHPALRNQILEKAATALGPEAFEKIFKKNAAEMANKLLSDAGLTKLVDKHVYSLLKGVDKKSSRQLAAELLESGLVTDAKQAKAMAKDMKQALSKSWYRRPHQNHDMNYFDGMDEIRGAQRSAATKRGQADDVMKAILQEGITREVREHLEKGMKQEFCERLTRTLKGQMDTPTSKLLGETMEKRAKILGRDVDSVVKENVDAAWKGAREGIEDATRKLVREGIDDAFKRFRGEKAAKLRAAFSSVFNRTALYSGKHSFGSHKEEESDLRGKDRRPEEETHKGRLEYHHKTYVRGGSVVKDTMVRHDGGRWELAAREELGLIEFAEARATEKITEALKSLLGAKSDVDTKKKAA